MVIVKLIGGLGNQMFQYAAGRRLAHALGVELKLDISWFATQDLRTYSLGVFNIQENIASPEEVATLKVHNQGIAERVIRRVLHKPPKQASTYIREKKKFHFDPDILNLPDGVYLHGSWQSEKYFADIQTVICREFTVKTPQTGKVKELAGRVASCESVSLHIRRGDYVSNAHANQIHGICDLDYYLRSVEHFTQILNNPHFFIFSDEPKKARNNLKLVYPATVVDRNGADKSYEDLRLMSQCKHHIIANSTFSWWAAWLSKNQNKIVLAPKRWFKSDDYDPKDLIPNKWIKIC
jgi:hypothetical protein